MTEQTQLYYLALHGAPQGPFDAATIHRMSQTGTLPPDALYCQVGATAWLPAAQFPGLHAPPAALPPPLPPAPAAVPQPLPQPAQQPLPPPAAPGGYGGPAGNFGPPAPVTGYGGPAAPAPEAPPAPGGPQFHVPRAWQQQRQAEESCAAPQPPADGTRGLRIAALLAALGCFFLPWLEFNCSGQPMMTQTGLQTVTKGCALDSSFQDKVKGIAAGQGIQTPEMSEQDSMKEVDIAWMTGAALVLAAVALFAAFGSSGKSTSAMMAGLAAMLLGFQAMTGFPIEQKLEEQMGKSLKEHTGRASNPMEAQAMDMAKNAFAIRYRAGFYITTGALVLAAVLGFTGGSPQPRRR